MATIHEVYPYLRARDAQAAVEFYQRAFGATEKFRLMEDMFYGERSGTIRDPFGYHWLVGHSIEEVSTEEMQRRYDRT